MKLHIPTQVQGTYFLDTQLCDTEAEWLVVGFHGFGELGDRQLDRLRLADWQVPTLLCSIQALHLMYNKDGSPGASWMTFHDRDMVIRDNLNYIRSIIECLKENYSWKKIAFCGFSQGGSMAHRAAYAIGCDLLLTAGGDIPPELLERDLSGYPPTIVVRGERDRIYSDEYNSRDLACLERNGVDLTSMTVKGGHKWPSVITSTIAERCRE